MQKRGQVAVFVVIGIAVVIFFALIFMYKDVLINKAKSEINTPQYLNDKIKNIQEEVIEECVDLETKDAIDLLLKNTGKFEEPVNYLIYNGKKHRVLCQNIPDEASCLSTPLSSIKINEKLNEYLKEKINNCLDFSDFENENYKLNLPEDFELETQINFYNLVVNLNYEIELVRDDYKVKSNNVIKSFDIPLGELIKAVNDVLEFRTRFGTFDPVVFGANSHSKYIAEMKKPYPDEIYTVYLTEYPDYKISFAVTSEGRYDRLEGLR